MPKYQLSRRELIEKCTALGVVVTATSLKRLHQIVFCSGLHGQYARTHIVEAGGD
jgi:hypothetical protein